MNMGITEVQLCRECNNAMQPFHLNEMHLYRHFFCRWDNTHFFWGVWYSEQEWTDHIMSKETQKLMKQKEKRKQFWEGRNKK